MSDPLALAIDALMDYMYSPHKLDEAGTSDGHRRGFCPKCAAQYTAGNVALTAAKADAVGFLDAMKERRRAVRRDPDQPMPTWGRRDHYAVGRREGER